MTLIKNTLERPFSVGLFIIVAIMLVMAPRYAKSYTVISLIPILQFVILTLSWTMFSGPTHYISLATAAFFGAGVYTSAVVGGDFSLLVVAGIGGLVSFVLAFLVGLLTLRLRGIYFILFTFGVSELLRLSLEWWEAHVTKTVGRFVLSPGSQTIYDHLVAITLITIISAYVIKHSRLGLALKSIGENEEAAAHIGINVTLVKTFGFAISAIFMGSTGAVMAYRLGYVDPNIAFKPENSFLPVVIAIFGGTSRLIGPILGAVMFIYLREFLITQHPHYFRLSMGATLIIVILFLPNGLLGLVDRIKHRLYRVPRFRIFLAWVERA